MRPPLSRQDAHRHARRRQLFRPRLRQVFPRLPHQPPGRLLERLRLDRLSRLPQRHYARLPQRRQLRAPPC